MHQAYIAGPYTAPTEEETLINIRRALEAAGKIAELGWFPIVPHAMGCHRSTWEEAMGQCRTTVGKLDPGSDVLVVLPGWKESNGTVEEIGRAWHRGVMIARADDLGFAADEETLDETQRQLDLRRAQLEYGISYQRLFQ